MICYKFDIDALIILNTKPKSVQFKRNTKFLFTLKISIVFCKHNLQILSFGWNGTKNNLLNDPPKCLNEFDISLIIDRIAYLIKEAFTVMLLEFQWYSKLRTILLKVFRVPIIERYSNFGH